MSILEIERWISNLF